MSIVKSISIAFFAFAAYASAAPTPEADPACKLALVIPSIPFLRMCFQAVQNAASKVAHAEFQRSDKGTEFLLSALLLKRV